MNENHNPWKVLGEKEVYDNSWINVTEYAVLNPAGNKGIYGKVHFKNIAIGIVPLDDEMNTYLVGQYRFVLNQYSWEIPEGGGQHNIDELASAKRELKEETGLVAKEWKEVLRMHLSNSVTNEQSVVFVARHLQQEAAMPEETEQLKVKKVPFATAYKMVIDGEITDAVAVAGILRVQLMINEGLIK